MLGALDNCNATLDGALRDPSTLTSPNAHDSDHCTDEAAESDEEQNSIRERDMSPVIEIRRIRKCEHRRHDDAAIREDCDQERNRRQSEVGPTTARQAGIRT